ncbi:hypothetical protein [Lacihabitans soyangensis]|nr:hypothetical protein [Lacihabitans soyangensis]
MDTNSKNLFFVLTCLTGTDRENIMAQASNLQAPVPSKGTVEYSTFLANFQASPANVLSTLAQFLQNRVNWAISSDLNFQTYLNQFNGAPFIVGVSSGPIQGKDSVHTIVDLINTCFVTAGVPVANRTEIAEQLQLEDLLAGDFEGSPITLSFIVQNMQSSDGNLGLVWKKTTLSVSYYPPEKNGIFDKKVKQLPTYTVVEQGTTISLTAQSASYFKANSEQFLGLGFTNVIDWMANNTTKLTKA